MKAPTTLRPLIAVCLVFFAGAQTHAASWFVPFAGSQVELWVKNTGSTPQTIWLSPPHRDGSLESEKSFEVPPQHSLQLPWPDSMTDSFLQVKAPESHSLHVLIKQQGATIQVQEGRSSEREGPIPTDAEALFVTNLSAIPQMGQVHFRSAGGATWIENFQLETFGQSKLSVRGRGIETAWIEGQQNLLAHVAINNAVRPVPLKIERVPATAARRFQVANSDRSLSFVAELSDPLQITQALDQIQHPEQFQARILIGVIDAGSAGVNRDELSPWKNSWSWHVSRVVKFAELASQACDGSPEFVEDFLLSWLDSKSPICFWNYRIIKELP